MHKKSLSSSKQFPPPGEKLQKVLARRGLGSRREIESWISSKRVLVNGEVAQLGDRVGLNDRLTVDGEQLGAGIIEQKHRCIIYHKPVGQICSRKEPKNRKTVFDDLPKLSNGRWISIGRLDYNTSGIILFTTDGDLAHTLMHPSSKVEREYIVRIRGEVKTEHLENMIEGIILDDRLACFSDIQYGSGEGSNSWFYVVLMEGRNREVRRLWESQGLSVSRLKRVRFGPIFIPSKLKQGNWIEISSAMSRKLYEMVSLSFDEGKVGFKEAKTMNKSFNRRPNKKIKKTR